jgi:hypothetical protein
MTRRLAPDGRRGGFSLVEMMIGSAILFVLGFALIESTTSLRRLTESGAVDARLQELAHRALKTVLTDLRRTGFADLGGGLAYPHVFEGGDAAAAFDAHDHAPSVQHAEAGDPDFGPSREIVFRLPADADADGVPDLDGDGNLVWDGAEFSYVLVTRPDGINYLERRVDGANPRALAHHVERVTFETSAQDPAGIPVGAIRVRIWLRDRDDRGIWHRFATEALVDPRNG